MQQSSRFIGLAAALLVVSTGGPLSASSVALNQNLIYNTISPCRVIDTRVAGGALAAGSIRQYGVVGMTAPGSLASQGGDPDGCPIPIVNALLDGPSTVQAILINFVVVAPAGPGDLVAWPSDQSKPTSSVINYTAVTGLNLANAVILPVSQVEEPGNDISVQAQVSGTHLVADVLGYFTSGSLTASRSNTFLGLAAGNLNTTGIATVAIGAGTLRSATTGERNTAVGFESLPVATSGTSNTALGAFTFTDLLTGRNNIAIGDSALGFLKTGNNNIAVGSDAGSDYTGAESNNISIGAVGEAGENGAIRIGSGQSFVFIAGVSGVTSSSGGEVFVNSFGQLGTATSSIRFKDDVADMADASTGLMHLRPVTFHYKPGTDDGSHLLQYGLVAEEVAKVYPDLVQYDRQGKPLAVRYHFVNAMMLNELQRQHRAAEAERDRVAELEALARSQAQQLESQRDRIERLERAVERLSAPVIAIPEE